MNGSTAAIAAFANHLPIRIRFGDGVLGQLPDVLDALAARRVAVVVDGGVREHRPVRAALAGCARRGRDIAEVVPDPGEPTLDRLDALGERLRALAVDTVVAIGGGSAIDSGKAARLVAAQGSSLAAYVGTGGRRIEPLSVRLVTVPTTAGSGSEVTGGIVWVDRSRRAKVGVASPHNRADDCLVDPTLTHALPAEPTVWGGVDALAQGIAAVVVRAHTPVGDALGLEAVRLAGRALPSVVADGADAGARSRMACASLLAGLAMNVSEAGSEHSLAHPLGARHGLAHGLTVGLVLAEALEHDRRFASARLERVADALGAAQDGSRDGSRAVRALQRLLADVRFPTLASVGISRADLDALADAALAGWIPVSPGPWGRGDVLDAYERALALGAAREPSSAGS